VKVSSFAINPSNEKIPDRVLSAILSKFSLCKQCKRIRIQDPGSSAFLTPDPESGSGMEKNPDPGSRMEKNPDLGSGMEKNPDPGSGMEKNPDPGSGMNIPDNFSESLETVF
jgi:hypothetical protein